MNYSLTFPEEAHWSTLERRKLKEILLRGSLTYQARRARQAARLWRMATETIALTPESKLAELAHYRELFEKYAAMAGRARK